MKISAVNMAEVAKQCTIILYAMAIRIWGFDIVLNCCQALVRLQHYNKAGAADAVHYRNISLGAI